MFQDHLLEGGTILKILGQLGPGGSGSDNLNYEGKLLL